MEVSRARRDVNRLYDQIGTLLETFLGHGPLFAASLYEHKSQCGNPQCKCARGPYRHRQWCVSFLDEQRRSRTRVVPRGVRDAVGKLTGEYRRVRRARRELGRLFGELVEAVDALGRARCEAGMKRYARLVAQARGEGASSRSRKGG